MFVHMTNKTKTKLEKVFGKDLKSSNINHYVNELLCKELDYMLGMDEIADSGLNRT